MTRLRVILCGVLFVAAPALAQFGPAPGNDMGPSGADRGILPETAPPDADAVINRELGLRRTLRLDDAQTGDAVPPSDAPDAPAHKGPFLERHDGGVRDPAFRQGG